jgi:DNA invertase Pin-like site-specific DNA recombinase
LYARISEDRTGEAAGVGRQIDDTRKLALSRGWDIVGEYVDNDISALTGGPRPQYAALMDAVRAGQVDRIVVYQTSRFWRNRAERAEGIEVLRTARIALVATKGPELDMTTAAGRAIAGVLGEFDTMEVEIKAERVARAAHQRALDGLNHGGPRAFGYSADGMSIDPAEAAEVRSAYKRILAGGKLAAIVRDLSERGVRTATGSPWAPATVRDMLLRPRYAGLSEYHGEVVGPGQWPATVSEETWRLAVALLKDPNRRTTTGNRAAYLLSGIARCGLCDKQITSGGRKRNDKGGVATYRQMYKCRFCFKVNRRQDWCDEYVTKVMVGRLSEPDAPALLVDAGAPDFEALTLEAGALQVRLNEVAAAFAEGEVTRAQLRTATEKIRARLAEIAAAQVHTSRAPLLERLVNAADVHAEWDAMDLDGRRAVVAALMTVVLHPGGGGSHVFDTSKVEIRWTDPP